MKKIAIHGVPRSGTTWVGSIFDSSPHVTYRHQPLFSYAFKSYLSSKSTKEEVESFFAEIKDTNDNFVLQTKEKARGYIPEFNKSEATHIVYKEARYHYIVGRLLDIDKEIKIVGIVRNPKSVLSSWLKAPKEFKKEWKFQEEWRNAQKKNLGRQEEFYGYEKWKEVASLFLDFKQSFPHQFYLLHYAQLLEDTEETVRSMFDFCGLEYTNQTKKFISSNSIDLSSNAYSVFRKNQADDKWKENLPTDIIEAINNDLKNTPLEVFV